MLQIESGDITQLVHFVAVDSTDLKTRETGLSSFTVYRARGGGAATAYTTPTVAELSSANMPGVYSLLLDEDMTITDGKLAEVMTLHITQASMAPVTMSVQLVGIPGVIRRFTAQAGAASSITLDASASATDDFYNGSLCEIIDNTGERQARVITDYVGSTKVATVDRPWVTNPDSTSLARLYVGSLPSTVEEIVDGTLDEALSGHTTAGTVGGFLNLLDDPIAANVTQISGDAVAADTLELFAEALDQVTGQLDSGSLASGTITAASIASAAITAAKFGAGAIDAAAIGTGAIDADAIAANAITSAKIATDAITSSQLADNAITAAKLASGAITAAKFAADAITSSVLASGAITSAKFAASAITNAAIANDAISDSKILNGAITADKFAAGAIDAAAIATDAIDGDALAASAVDEILDDVIEGSTTLRQLLRGYASALLGKANGLSTTTANYRDLADTKNRIVATVDADGNRSAVTLDLT